MGRASFSVRNLRLIPEEITIVCIFLILACVYGIRLPVETLGGVQYVCRRFGGSLQSVSFRAVDKPREQSRVPNLHFLCLQKGCTLLF